MGCTQAKTLPAEPTVQQDRQKVKELVDSVVINGIKCAAHYPEGDGQYPVLVFIHGGGVPDSNGYSRTIGQMVSAGFIVVANMQDYMNGGVRGGAKYTHRIITGLNSGVLRSSANTGVIGLVGHSLGGLTVSSWATSNYASAHPEVKALVTFHGPMWVGNAKRISMPVLVVSGNQDWIVRPSKMLNTYRDSISQQKVFIDIRGVGHTAMCDDHADVGEGRAAAVAFQAWLNHDSAALRRLYEQLGEDMALVSYLRTPDKVLEIDV